MQRLENLSLENLVSSFDNERLAREDPEELKRLLDLAESTEPIGESVGMNHGGASPRHLYGLPLEPTLTPSQRGASLDALESAKRKPW